VCKGQHAMFTITASNPSGKFIRGFWITSLFEFNRHSSYNMIERKERESKDTTWSIPEYARNTSPNIIAKHEFSQKEGRSKVPALHASWKVLQYSFLPKFLHHSWDGIGRTGWCGRCCIKVLLYLLALWFPQFQNKMMNTLSLNQITQTVPYCIIPIDNRSQADI